MDGPADPGDAAEVAGSAGSAASAASSGVAREYAQWLERLRATFEAVRYTCAHRLADPRLAEQVSAQVVAGLVARPTVFRYFGLPYSGRIAMLAEDRIAAADAGLLGTGCGWAELWARLHHLPAEHQEVFVAVCLRGTELGALATALGCDEAAAAARREAALHQLRHLAAPGLAPVATASPHQERDP